MEVGERRVAEPVKEQLEKQSACLGYKCVSEVSSVPGPWFSRRAAECPFCKVRADSSFQLFGKSTSMEVGVDLAWIEFEMKDEWRK